MRYETRFQSAAIQILSLQSAVLSLEHIMAYLMISERKLSHFLLPTSWRHCTSSRGWFCEERGYNNYNIVSPDDVFKEVLDVFYGGKPCEKTFAILGLSQRVAVT